MYSWEIYKYLEERNFCVGGDDLIKVISPFENPQLAHIQFNPFDNTYDMWDVDGNYFHFVAIPFIEAKEKGLVKKYGK